MARTVFNASNGGFLTEKYSEVKPLGVIDQDTASESNGATAPSKVALKDAFDTADHSVMQGFGARDARHSEWASEHRSFKFDGNSSAKVADAGNVSSAGSSHAGSDQTDSAVTPIETALNTQDNVSAQPAAKSAAAASVPSTNAVAAAAAPAAQVSGYPDASNTGVKAGVAMTKYNGTLHITTDNAVISNMEVTGDIVIDAKNVTLSNIKLISGTPYHALRVMDGATGFTLQDSEIDGRGTTGNAIYGHGTFLRNNLHDVENGMNVWGPAVVQGNYIHGLRSTGSDPHYDGIQMTSGKNIDIIGNTIINDHDQTAAIGMGNTFGDLSDIKIDGNRLVGGGYVIYLDGRKGGGTVDDASIQITNNQIGGGKWGDYALYDEKPVMHGNTGLDTLPETTPPVNSTEHIGTAGDDTMPVAGKTNAGGGRPITP